MAKRKSKAHGCKGLKQNGRLKKGWKWPKRRGGKKAKKAKKAAKRHVRKAGCPVPAKAKK